MSRGNLPRQEDILKPTTKTELRNNFFGTAQIRVSELITMSTPDQGTTAGVMVSAKKRPIQNDERLQDGLYGSNAYGTHAGTPTTSPR